MSDIKATRRSTIKSLVLGSAAGIAGSMPQTVEADALIELEQIDKWSRTHDRVWIGEEFWSNPMEDWRISDGWAQCQTSAESRSIHSVTRQITNSDESFAMSIELSQSVPLKNDGGAGFKFGIKSDLNEYRSNCFAKNGLNAGIIKGELVIGQIKAKLEHIPEQSHVVLNIIGTRKGPNYILQMVASDPNSDKEFGHLRAEVPAARLLGNIAVVSQYTGPKQRTGTPGYKFRNWLASGKALSHNSEQAFGPILWTMYTLSDSRTEDGFVLKLSALLGPIGKEDCAEVEMYVKRNDKWTPIGKAGVKQGTWTATYRVPNWDESTETPFKIIYQQEYKAGNPTRHEWHGTILANPTGRPFRLAALTCQNDYAFPYAPVAENIVKMKPDMLYFSGDQLYESHGGFGVIRRPAEPAILNYLRKYYQFGWAFGNAMRHVPTVVIPDDHDVFHGNIWGESGAAMKDLQQGTSSKGGYRQPAEMVNVVHHTHCSHHPEPFDPTPVKQNISVYYGDLVYGNVSFAILGDRQFKSGPERVNTGPGRADHVPDQNFDTRTLDKDGLVLLGDRQELFLRKWASDWRGHSMKVLLSQTVLGGAATHHGGFKGYLKADLDSGGWPQSGRDRAIDIVRPSMALHINGDQHLASLIQYGVEKQRDSNWSFCTPAIAVGYPRWWRADEMEMPHENRPQHGLAHTGEFLDGLGNKIYVYSVGNPEVASKRPRYERAHQKGSGFGFVLIDTDEKTYTLNAFRFLCDPTDEAADSQFLGWPLVIHQDENKGENRAG